MKESRPVLLALIALLGAVASGFAAPSKPHVLFLAVDDLRPELGCYGSPIARTPHIDALAAEGILFKRAYCQQAICSPSRASLMTGARPDTIGVVENTAYFRDLNPEIITLPQHFRSHGYETVYCGKIFHARMDDRELSWSRGPAWNRLELARPTPYARPENVSILQANKAELTAKYGPDGIGGLVHGPAYESADVSDETYPDGHSARLAIETLKDHLEKKPEQPLFLALGFKKPHLHFIAPKKYWDLYDPEEISLAENRTAPADGAAMGLHASFELRVRHGIPKEGPIGDELSRTLLHAYLACVSYVDAQVGLAVAALEEAGIRDNTVIILWGDHGWHLGDHGVWGKATNYEIATRVPLILSAPGMKVARGTKTDALVELIDMYPTLCDLAGLPQPAHLEGHSFAPLLEESDQPWKQAAFSQYPNPALREWAANPLSSGMRETFFGPLIEEVEQRIMRQMGDRWDRELFENHLMGYTVRTDQHRLVAWKDRRDPSAAPIFLELYDHATDPGETSNVAAAQPEEVKRLLEILEAGWQEAGPPQ